MSDLIKNYKSIAGHVAALAKLCPNNYGIEEAFRNVDSSLASGLVDLAFHFQQCLYWPVYNEALDFIDGNGFCVKGDDRTGYIITSNI